MTWEAESWLQQLSPDTRLAAEERLSGNSVRNTDSSDSLGEWVPGRCILQMLLKQFCHKSAMFGNQKTRAPFLRAHGSPRGTVGFPERTSSLDPFIAHFTLISYIICVQLLV